LSDLGMPPDRAEPGTGRGTAEGRAADGTAVEVQVEALPPPVTTPAAAAAQTRVSVRVGVFGDESLSERYLDQVLLRLTTPGAAVPVPVAQQQSASACPGSAVPLPAETAPPPLAKGASP
jgi:hypothetical protein